MSGRPGALGERLSLRPGVYCAHTGDGAVHLVSSAGSESLGRADPALVTLLRSLAAQPATMAELVERYQRAGGEAPEGLPALLGRMRAGGWLALTVTSDGAPFYTVVPDQRPPPRPAGEPAELVLSRFALLHREGGEFILESPRAWCQLRLADPQALALLGELRPDRPVAAALPGPAGHRLRTDLWWAGIAQSPAASDREEEQLRLRQWAPHELWLHDRSRIGRRGPGRPYGGTWWARGRFDPPPAEPAGFGPAVALPRPDLAALRATDPPVTAVLEDRRSVRRHDDTAPVRLPQLAEFLYRCARDRRRYTADGFEYLSRPYPAGGSAYELEIYPVVRKVAGLPAGMYHYHAGRHRLERVNAPDRTVRRLLRAAAWGMGGGHEPQLLLVIAARFGRVMFKYEQMAYALILKHVGVLYQMMYTVATAMRLAPCGLGAGDSGAFAEATGLDPMEESSVGEFALGSLPVPGGAGQ